MSPAGSVTADQLVRALDRHDGSLPAEIGTFIVLEGCESMLQAGPRELTGLGSVRISEQGLVSLSGIACGDETAARGLHRCLATLLLAAGPSLPPALSRLAEQGPRGGAFSLRALHDELEAALVPLNRNASRRVLSRFAREAAQGPLDHADVDAALNSLLGARSAPANDAPGSPDEGGADSGRSSSIRSSSPEVRQGELFDGLDMGGEESHYFEAAARPSRERPSEDNAQRGARASTRPSLSPPSSHAPLSPYAPAPRDRDGLRSLRLLSDEPGFESSGSSSRKLILGFGLIALAVIGVSAALALRAARQAEPVQVAAPVQPAPAREQGGDLAVHVSAPNAQVLRFVGRAPVTIDRLPVGVAHEFVATADGFRPSRVLLAADADWEATPDGARYELALQLDPVHEPADAVTEQLELGPSRLASQVSGQPARLGSVRVVSTPRGARVYQLVGFSPDTKVQDVRLAEPQELLVYREGYVPVVRVLQASDFKPQGDRRVATVDVTLSKREPSKRQ